MSNKKLEPTIPRRLLLDYVDICLLGKDQCLFGPVYTHCHVTSTGVFRPNPTNVMQEEKQNTITQLINRLLLAPICKRR